MFSGTIIKDKWTKPRGRGGSGEEGGVGWSRGEVEGKCRQLYLNNKKKKRTPEHLVCGCQGLGKSLGIGGSRHYACGTSITLKDHRLGTGGTQSHESLHSEARLYQG